MVPYEVESRECVLKVLFVQVNFLCIPILINLNVSLGNLGDKVIQSISLLLFFLWSTHIFIYVFIRIFTSRLTLSVSIVFKYEVWSLLSVQSCIFVKLCLV